MYISIYIYRERERAIYISPYFILLRLNPFDFNADREG